MPKVLFYSNIARTFRTTLIANLYEIAQVWPVILLSEELDAETNEALKDKTLFPKLKEIVPVGLFKVEDPDRPDHRRMKNLFFENIRVYKLARDLIKKYKPTIIVTPSDDRLFDFYLTRFAKKNNILYVVIHPDVCRPATSKEMCLRVDLTHVYFKFPHFLPFSLRLFLARARRYCGYVIYNILLPLSIGQAPFWGKASQIFYSMPGSRADYCVTCSKSDYELSIKDGVPKEKMTIHYEEKNL